jgi:hypothetical protein
MPKRGRPDAPMQEAGAVTAPPTKVAADGAGEGAGGRDALTQEGYICTLLQSTRKARPRTQLRRGESAP